MINIFVYFRKNIALGMYVGLAPHHAPSEGQKRISSLIFFAILERISFYIFGGAQCLLLSKVQELVSDRRALPCSFTVTHNKIMKTSETPARKF